MKTRSWIFILLSVLFFSNSAEAQLLKTLEQMTKKQPASKAADSTSGKGSHAKTSTGTSGAQPTFGAGKDKADVATIPDSYPFTWKYSMEIQSGKGQSMTADYLLEPGAEYFAFKMGQAQDMFMIMDNKNKLIVTAFGNGKEKMASASKMQDYTEMAEKENAKSKFTYKTLPDKTILGYKCKGVEATNEEYIMVFYFTNDAKVSFSDMFKSQRNHKVPDVFAGYFKPGDRPLTMSVDITDRKKGATTTMKCVALEKSPYVFQKSDYKFM